MYRIYKVRQILMDIDTKVSSMSNRLKIAGIAIISVLFFLIVLKLNLMTPMWGDDYAYSFNFNGDKLHSFSDIFISQYYHYFNWGGRSVVHFIAQCLLMLPAVGADFINSCVFVFFLFLIYFHIKGKNKEHSISLFILIFISIWFLQPAFGETVLWITGSANYLWGTSIVLLFLLPYRLYDNKSKSTFIKTICLFCFGIIAGWTNENISVALIIMLILWLFYWKKRLYHIPVWAIAGLLGAVLGSAMLILAPGNYIRIGALNANYSLFAFYYRFNIFTMRFMHNLGYLNIITSILLILVLHFSSFPRKYFLSIVFIYTIGILISIYVMLGSPTFPARAWFGVITLNIIVFGLVFYHLNNNLKFIRCIKYLILSIAIISFIFDFYNSYKDIKATNIEWVERESLIKQAIAEQKDKVEIQPIHANTKYSVGDAPWVSIFMSRYYQTEIVMK